MIPIRTKLVVAQLLLILLPVLPLYYLVKGFLEQSLEIGLNRKVESALERATEISQTLYSTYREESLALAQEIAASKWVVEILNERKEPGSMRFEKAELGRVDLYDSDANLIFSTDQESLSESYKAALSRLPERAAAGVLEAGSDPGQITVFVPVLARGKQLGYVLVTRNLPEGFARASQQVVEVHQMFKTLGWVRGDLKRSFLLAFFAVYAPFALLSIVAGYFLSRRITAPLAQLADGTRKVAEGDWDYRMKVTSKDEAGQLMEAFNRMISSLKEKQDQIIALEKMAVWREIARILAHEIKNPLTPIQLTVQQLKDKYSGDDVEYQRLLAECTEIVSDEIESLRSLVREFSEFARMPKLNLAPADLNELVEEVTRLYPESHLRLELDPNLPEFDFDYEKMRRVLINLIDNAIDSIKQKGEGDIRIETRRQGEWVSLSVSDQGCGISPEVRERIFEPYFSTKKSGVGLGLAIVRRIVEEHGGTVSVDSRPGEGTTFVIRLPV
jgi:nitrogen fixation/metabolism regulation signal transduction histidine kinase